jgi:hypothetical protein
VLPVYPRGQNEIKARAAALIESLCADGRLSGGLRIPNTAGDLLLEANLRSRRIIASLDVGAPHDRGARGRVSWLVSQLEQAPGQLLIESYPRNARLPTTATLSDAREDRLAPLDSEKREPHRFRLVLGRDMGMGRSTGTRTPGFITSVLGLLNDFYGSVVQEITGWQPPAPKLSKPAVVQDEGPAAEDGVRPDPRVLPWSWEQEED